jgi:hypothetical protein
MKTIVGRRGCHHWFWAVFAALLYSGPATPEGDITAEPARMAIAEPARVAIAEPAHLAITEPAHVAIAEPVHVAIAEPAHVAIAEPAHVAITEPAYVAVALARPHITVPRPDARVEPAEAETEAEEGSPLPPIGVKTADDDPVIDETLAKPRVKIALIDVPEGCSARQDCIDQYLWAIYERTRKVDTIKVPERIKVTVTKKGKTRTITKTVIKFVDDDFTWKDPKAAERFRITVKDYVIGGMDRNFRVRLFHLLRAMEEAGLAPGMTSGFRDDYRQSIASGHKAATGRSFHGGSQRGGYGRGLAADIVSIDWETRPQRWSAGDIVWKWIDANGLQYGIGRPYLDKDPPHVAPMDGQEFVSRRGSIWKRAAALVTK